MKFIYITLFIVISTLFVTSVHAQQRSAYQTTNNPRREYRPGQHQRINNNQPAQRPEAPPANDDPCNAQPLTVNAICSYSTYTNAQATASAGVTAPGCANYLGGDVWFSVTVPANGTVNIDCNTAVITDGGMAAYSGSCGSLSLIACDDDASVNGLMPMLNLTGLTPLSTIYIRFWEYGNDNNGTFQICASSPLPVSNDNPCSATLLPVGGTCNYSTYTNAGATATSGVPAPGCSSYLGGDVWFKIVVPASGTVDINTNTAVITDGGMAVYSGSCGSLSLVACDDDGSPNGLMPEIVLTGRNPGDTLWIRFWEYGNDNNGTFQICASTFTPITNDNPCNATLITAGTTCNYTTYTNAGATGTTGVSTPSCSNYLGGDVWFKIKVPASGLLSFDSQTGVMTDGAMAVYTGNCNSLTEIACDDDGSANGLMPALNLSGLTPGDTLWIRFFEYGNNNNGTFGLCAYEPTPPPNDNCASATALTINGGCLPGTTDVSSLQASETVPSCISNGGASSFASVWYRFNSGSNATLNLSWILTNDANCYPGIVVWGPYAPGSGCLPSGTPFYCLDIQDGDPGFHTTLNGLTANMDYLVQVINRNCTGSFDQYQDFCMGIYTPVPNDAASGATQMGQCGFSFTGSNEGASVNSCGTNNANLDCNAATTGTACGASTTGSDVSYVINNETWWYFCSFAAASWQISINSISNCTLTDPLNQGLQLSIFSGTPSNLTCIQSAPNPTYPGDTWTSSTFNTTAGQCIYIVIDGFAGDVCDYSFTLNNISGGCIILPVKLGSFTAEAIGKQSLLKWSMEAEKFNEPYLVERSSDGSQFFTIGTVQSQNSNGLSAYRFTDRAPIPGLNYYRIRYIDEKGLVRYTETRTVYFGQTDKGCSVYPTITSSYIHVNVADHDKVSSVDMVSSVGAIVRSNKIGLDNNQLSVQGLSSGLYYLVVRYKDGSFEKTPFIKK